MLIELFDFSDPRAADAWRGIDDRVMGGVSRSRLRYDRAGHAVFEGEVSLAQNGGFASVRSSPGARGQRPPPA
jgi:NADH dehydrogenase [ubiquinone] 1 alpha subcomplex assembly factor 1